MSDRRNKQIRSSDHYQRPNERKSSDIEIESALKSALLEKIPPRPKDIALRLGYSTDSAIRCRFPAQIQAVVGRRKIWEESQRKVRRQVLQLAILEVPPPNISELSKRHGSGFSKFFLNREIDLVTKLEVAIKSFEQRRNEEIRRVLEAALVEQPAPTMRIVGDRLGCQVEVLRKKHPEIVARIAARCRNYKSEAFRKKREVLEQEVLTIALQLNEAGMPPRYDCVIPMLSKDSLYKWDEISKAIQKATHTLRLEPAKSGPASKTAISSESKSQKKPAKGEKVTLVAKRTLNAAS